MPRPRRDSEILPAKERLENAFWELLAERNYHKITVTDIVRVADVNRNSFYYHFSGLPELADSAILHAVENTPIPSRPGANFNPDDEWRKHITALLRNPDQRQRLDRLALLAGPHSSPELIESLRDFGRRWPKLHEQLPIDTVFNEDLAVLAAGMFMSMSRSNMLDYWRRIFSNRFVPGANPRQ